MTIAKIKQIAFEKYGKALTDEQAAGYLEKYGKLTDSELDSVSGSGGCDSLPEDYCKKCVVKLAQDEDGNTYCPNCTGSSAKIL